MLGNIFTPLDFSSVIFFTGGGKQSKVASENTRHFQSASFKFKQLYEGIVPYNKILNNTVD